jgi:ribonuclease E
MWKGKSNGPGEIKIFFKGYKNMPESPADSSGAAVKTPRARKSGASGKKIGTVKTPRNKQPENANPEDGASSAGNPENAETTTGKSAARTTRPRNSARSKNKPAASAPPPEPESASEPAPEPAVAPAGASPGQNGRPARASGAGRARRPRRPGKRAGLEEKRADAAEDAEAGTGRAQEGAVLEERQVHPEPGLPVKEPAPEKNGEKPSAETELIAGQTLARLPEKIEKEFSAERPEDPWSGTAEPDGFGENSVPESAGAEAEDAADEKTGTLSADSGGEVPEHKPEPSSGKKPGKSGRPEAGAGGRQTRAKRKMFVSVLPGEQVEVVIAEDGQVQEYYIEMLHQVKVKGNIYKGVIHNVDPNLQAAFVAYGAVKNGFLQIDEVHPEYYLAPHEAGKAHKYPLIQKVLKPGQEVLVQVVKEPSGTKGAFLTSYLSLPGRFLVLTPGREQIGVSRKVENEEERARLRTLLSGLNPGEGLGVIVRTVSEGTTKTNLQRDLQQLKRVWKEVRKKGSTESSPSLIYQEMALDTRAVRDYLTEEITELWVDDEEMAGQIRELVAMLFPKRDNVVHLYNNLEQSLFEAFNLKKQLEQVHSREVTLPSGGRLVFDHTEALMAIDINSGRAAGKNNFEDTAYKTNLEAARQIPLQLRLRDIGGQVVIDFIEMRDRSHWREIEKTVRNGMKGDRARHDIGKISSFGLLEIVRQRLSTSAISNASELCPCCKGTGQRRNMEWQALQALREIRSLLRKHGENGSNPVVYTHMPELVLYLLNQKKERLLEMEKSFGVRLELRPGSK